MRVGTRVRVIDVSSDSMRLFSKYKRRVPGLTCACNFHEATILRVTDVLTPDIVLVQVENRPSMLSIIYTKDLKKVQ